ncbi:mitochondrial import inner membrane translocase subunit Tim13 [Chytridium lagenaria]|nr:mitochondrial import inner membrane translocase subunit Tim13 [Chytridium lagenaria]
MDKIKEQIRNELALANYQDLLQRINGKCFAKCISKPGVELSNSDEGCISKCAAMYIETWNTVSATYLKKIQQSPR